MNNNIATAQSIPFSIRRKEAADYCSRTGFKKNKYDLT
jgi:hypothetical protein